MLSAPEAIEYLRDLRIPRASRDRVIASAQRISCLPPQLARQLVNLQTMLGDAVSETPTGIVSPNAGRPTSAFIGGAGMGASPPSTGTTTAIGGLWSLGAMFGGSALRPTLEGSGGGGGGGDSSGQDQGGCGVQ